MRGCASRLNHGALVWGHGQTDGDQDMVSRVFHGADSTPVHGIVHMKAGAFVRCDQPTPTGVKDGECGGWATRMGRTAWECWSRVPKSCLFLENKAEGTFVSAELGAFSKAAGVVGDYNFDGRLDFVVRGLRAPSKIASGRF